MVPFWNHYAAMPNLSIKNVPEWVVEKLRARATANHRSLQGELMALVCQAADDRETAQESRAQTEATSGWKSIEQILTEHKAARPKVVTKGPRAVDIVRKDRDTR